MNLDRCSRCRKLLIAMTDRTGKTRSVCVKCDKIDPMKTDALKWANSPLGRTSVVRVTSPKLGSQAD
jgi:hypothetical protein